MGKPERKSTTKKSLKESERENLLAFAKTQVTALKADGPLG